MIINFNVTAKTTPNEIAKTADDIAGEMIEEISTSNPEVSIRELQLLTGVGFNLIVNGLVNRVMTQTNHNASKAKEILPGIVDQYREAFIGAVMDNLKAIESGQLSVTAVGNATLA